MQLLHGLCCFDFVLDIPLPPATLSNPICVVLHKVAKASTYIVCALFLAVADVFANKLYN